MCKWGRIVFKFPCFVHFRPSGKIIIKIRDESYIFTCTTLANLDARFQKNDDPWFHHHNKLSPPCSIGANTIHSLDDKCFSIRFQDGFRDIKRCSGIFFRSMLIGSSLILVHSRLILGFTFSPLSFFSDRSNLPQSNVTPIINPQNAETVVLPGFGRSLFLTKYLHMMSKSQVRAISSSMNVLGHGQPSRNRQHR